MEINDALALILFVLGLMAYIIIMIVFSVHEKLNKIMKHLGIDHSPKE
jgi:hypothetical protein